MNSDWILVLATGIWGIYALVVGTLSIVDGFTGNLVWITIITAIVGNSAHLVTFAYQKGKIQIQATGQVGKPPSTTGTTN